jgi:hypothetical protein
MSATRLALPLAERISPALVHKAKAIPLDQISHTLRSWRIQPPCPLNKRDTTNRVRGQPEVYRNHFLRGC